MPVTVGTFNLNNLFSRFNFQAEIEQDVGGGGEALEASYTFSPTRRRFGFAAAAAGLCARRTTRIESTWAQRLLGSHPDIEVHPPDVDVWAVQEVEDIDTLRFFAQHDLGGAYPHVVLIEGNDPRLIDVAVLSKLPLGAVTSWQHAVHPADPGERVFGRDLLEVEVLNIARTERLLTLFNTHLKSHFVPHDEDQEAGAAKNS
jgi:hypothetical protein